MKARLTNSLQQRHRDASKRNPWMVISVGVASAFSITMNVHVSAVYADSIEENLCKGGYVGEFSVSEVIINPGTEEEEMVNETELRKKHEVICFREENEDSYYEVYDPCSGERWSMLSYEVEIEGIERTDDDSPGASLTGRKEKEAVVRASGESGEGPCK